MQDFLFELMESARSLGLDPKSDVVREAVRTATIGIEEGFDPSTAVDIARNCLVRAAEQKSNVA